MATTTKTAKKATKTTAKKATKVAETSQVQPSQSPGKTIQVLVKGNPFKKETKRHQKFTLIKTGATLRDTCALIREKGLSSPRTFIANCVRMGHLKIT